MSAIQKIAILGGGQMGAGIAESAASRGISVTLIKATPGPSDKARAGIEKGLNRLAEKGKITAEQAKETLGRITFTDKLEAAADADLFIESIVENLDIKRKKFAEADAILKKDGILASNTSTLCITAMQSATKRPDRFVGLHFFNPATMMKLVEVIPTETTRASVTVDVVAFVEHIGKTPVMVKDSTGFIVNRLLTPYMCDAMRALEAGLADIPGIDTAMQLGANHPMGPLALADYIGLDIVHAMAENLYASFKQEYMAPPDTLKMLVKHECLGRKSKLGFYDYSHSPAKPNPALSKPIRPLKD
jgi:3-hydroxybutyryl-CoA dehydrogenase